MADTKALTREELDELWHVANDARLRRHLGEVTMHRMISQSRRALDLEEKLAEATRRLAALGSGKLVRCGYCGEAATENGCPNCGATEP